VTTRLSSVLDWARDRSGWEDLAHLAAKKEVPVHRHTIFYYLGGMALFLFSVQVATGILLLLYYRPSSSEAFESVQYVMAEVPFGNAPLRLSPLAQSSGNRVVAIGYDCIPVVSADLVPTLDSSRFVEYLSVIKHAHGVAGISESAAAEFQGFVKALPSQGLKGPAVLECLLPAASGAASSAPHRDRTGRPMVLMVGSFEPRKNHLGVLHAAETLWREGLDFELTFIGGSGWGSEIPDRIAALTQFGRPITVLRNVDQARLDQTYRSARFTVFPSRHEGYGLPVAESLEAGTPAITSDFGSLRELAAGGGALMVDPHDDIALANAMRGLLSDDAELALLRRQIADRPPRTWDDYADELWTLLVAPLLLPER